MITISYEQGTLHNIPEAAGYLLKQPAGKYLIPWQPDSGFYT